MGISQLPVTRDLSVQTCLLAAKVEALLQALIQARWLILLAAFLCGWSTALPWVYPPALYWDVSFDWALPVAAVLQGMGTFAMSKSGARRLWVIIGYISAAAWLIAFLGALAGVAAGAGGLVYGFFVLMPALVVGALTQVVALIGFARR